MRMALQFPELDLNPVCMGRILHNNIWRGFGDKRSLNVPSLSKQRRGYVW